MASSGTRALPRYISTGSPGRILKRFDISEKVRFRKNTIRDTESVSPSPVARHATQKLKPAISEEERDNGWSRQFSSYQASESDDYSSSFIDLLNELSHTLHRPYVLVIERMATQMWAIIEENCGKDWTTLETDYNVSYFFVQVLIYTSQV